MIDFIAIDFETANRNSTSICAIGMVKYQQGELVYSRHDFIRPKPFFFEKGNVRVHGITPSDVTNALDFGQWWAKYQQEFDDAFFLAHNAAFDMGALRQVLDLYDLPYPNLDYACTFQLSQKLLPGLPGYGLSKLAKHFGINFDHHNAEEDARACARVFHEILQANSIQSLKQLQSQSGFPLKKVHTTAIKGIRGKTNLPNRFIYLDPKSIFPQTEQFNPYHPFYQKKIVFTGNLQSLSRQDAMQQVVNLGAIVHPASVSLQTRWVVLGSMGKKKNGQPFVTSKLQMARALIEEGKDIEIIDERTFLKMLDS